MTHPRDHILALSAQLRSDMTTIANVTVKVSVNAGTDTTYNSGTTPAVTQDPDVAFAYKLQIPAGTYAAGDVIAAKWLYDSGSGADAVAYDTATIGPASVDGAHYTNARGDNLANLDATISSRSTVAAIWAAVIDAPGVTTLLSRLTSGRASNLDNLDAAITTRLAAADYTAPDNAGIAAIQERTDNLPDDPADQSVLAAAIAALPSASSIASQVWAATVRTLSRHPRAEE